MQDTANNKTSILVSEQLPAFVREDHETFVKFIEYYYRFLEQDGQQSYVSKNFLNYLNIDLISEDILSDNELGANHQLREEGDYHSFLQKMYDTYIKYIPDTLLTDKVTFLKHAKEFYLSTGSEKSVRFLIRALLNKDADFYYPKTDILRASDGKWFIEKSLKVTDIRVNNVSNSMAVGNFSNTTIIGLTSNAAAAVEKVDSYFDKGQIIYELKLSNIYKEFFNAEKIFAYYTEEGVDKYLTANLFSGVITSVQIVSGGAGYTEGTSVPVISTKGSGAQVVISKVTKGTIQAAGVVKSGAGFKVNDNLVIAGPGIGALGHVSDVDKTGFYHPNSYNVIWTTINLEANTAIGNAKYSNLVSTISDPANAWITNSMSSFVYANCGPVFSCAIDNGGNNYYPPISITISANSIISKLGILGKMQIISGGTGYVVGDWIQFDNSYGSSGSGAIANVTNVAANGMITEVHFQQIKGQIVGGSGYDWRYLPSANIRSATGSGANIAVTAVIGHNEELIQSVSNIGTIQALTIVSGGTGYTDIPTLALNTLGDGTANAILTTVTGVYSYPGRYITDDGHISSYNFLEDRDYYQEFSYVVKVDETINKYRTALKDLTHPAGAKLFGEYNITFDDETTTNTNISIGYANTEVTDIAYKTYYQVQGYTPGVFSPNIASGFANAEFVAGSFTVNTTNHVSTYAAQNNSIVVYYPLHSFKANQSIYFQFSGKNTWANLANTSYIVSTTNTNYIFVNNPLKDANGNTGTVTVFSPDVMVTVPYSRPSVGDTVYLQFKTLDSSLANGFYQVSGVKSVNTFNILHPNMTTANDAANVANLITKKIVVTANNHGFAAGDQAYILFLNGDTANTHNGYYSVSSVGSANTFNIAGQNIIFTGSTTRTYQKSSKIVITGHPYSNGTHTYISFVGGDQANAVNGIYQPVKTGSDTLSLNVTKPLTANANVRVWYQTNNYSNIMFTALRSTSGFSATDNVEITFYGGGSDLANGIYMIKNAFSSNTYNIYYNANTYLQNAWGTYHSTVFIPGNPNTINVIAYSGVGIVANSVMEGTSLVSPYK